MKRREALLTMSAVTLASLATKDIAAEINPSRSGPVDVDATKLKAGNLDFRALATRLVKTIVDRGNEVVFGDKHVTDDLLQGEALRYFTRLFAKGLISQVEGNYPAHPNFIKILSPWLNTGYPNPDGTYHFVNLHGDYSYRIYGTRGTARLFDVEMWEGDLSDLANARSIGGRRDIYRGKSDLHINDDGTFEIVVSTEKQQSKNWIALPHGHACLYIRQWYYDYENEVPGLFYIERIGETFPRPALTAQDHSDNFERMIRFLDNWNGPINKGIAGHYAAEPNTVVFPTGLINAGNAFRNQSYGRGRFTLGPDEAIILEVTPPQAEYWMFDLMSPFWEAYDWLGRQISINGHQAVIDDDGKFRAVIAHQDPGVPNWLDAGNHAHGLIGARYNWSDDIPIPTLTTVPFATLAEHLPKSTQRITPAERHEILRRRLLSQRRRGVDW